MLAKLVIIEGPDKVGKQTQSNRLAHALRRYGDRVKLVEVPFNDKLTYRLIYWMLRSGKAKTHPNVFQFTQFLNKLIFQWTYLMWLRLTCDYVVLDRWRLSSIVYGDATGTNRTFNRLMYHALTAADVTVILHGPSFKRRTVDDAYERDSALQRDVRLGYYSWAVDHPVDHELVDNQGTQDEVHERIMDVVILGKVQKHNKKNQPCEVCDASPDEDCDAGLHS